MAQSCALYALELLPWGCVPSAKVLEIVLGHRVSGLRAAVEGPVLTGDGLMVSANAQSTVLVNPSPH